MNTIFRNERIQRILMDLKGLMIKEVLPAEQVFLLKGRYDSVETAEPHKQEARPFPPYGQWSGRNAYFWFFTSAQLPRRFSGDSGQEALLLRVSTAVNQQPDTALLSSFVSAPSHRWDLMNPQFMLFVNGRLRQGLDTNHTEVFLNPEDLAGGSLRLDFQAYTGLTDASYGFLPELCVADPTVKELYYDILTLFESALALPEQDTARFSLLAAINESLNLLDLRSPGSEAFYAGIRAARAFLAEHGFGPADPALSVTCFGHTHIDLAWLWDLGQTRLKAQRSFATVLSLMEHHPDYCFMHTSPQLYAWLKQDNPALYANIVEKIEEGRWEPEGAMWVEADCNLPCGESLSRQLLYGKRFIRNEFGRDSRVLWLPDVFGYSAALPQLLKKAGIDCFVTSKISWNMLNTMPYDTFSWKGIDGTEILTDFITTPELGTPEGNCGATYNGVLHPETVMGAWKQYKQKEINRDVFLCYGYGDGGGGPTDEMLEKLERLKKGVPGFPTVRSGPIQPYFRDLARRMEGQKYLPKWTGELYLELHQGTYTSNARIKWNNRRAEAALMSAEALQSFVYAVRRTTAFTAAASTAAGCTAAPGLQQGTGSATTEEIMCGQSCEAACAYPAGELHDLWETLLLNQFHDILPGSCIREVYEESDRQFKLLFSRASFLQRQALNWLAAHTASPEDGFLLYNPSCFARDEVLAFSPAEGSLLRCETAPPCEEYGRITGGSPADRTAGSCGAAAVIGLKDAEGRLLPCQKLPGGKLLAAVSGIPGLGCMQLFPVFAPAKDMTASTASDDPAASVFPENRVPAVSAGFVSPDRMENDFFLLTFNETGQISRLFDKQAGRELLGEGCAGNQLTVYEDRPLRWDSWNIDMYYEEKSWPVTELLSRELTECGPVRYSLIQRFRYNRSAICQTIRLYGSIPRIDFLTEVDWQEDASVLKAEFPVRINADYASYEIQYGSVRRPTHANTSWDTAKYEVCAHRWADLSEGGYGVSLMNDCKYGYSIRDGRMRLTLLKAGMAPDPKLDRGRHRFTYSLYPHGGGPLEGGTVQAAQALNLPLFCTRIRQQEGPLSAGLSFFSCDLPDITLDCIKKAEDGEALILRFYENGNRHVHARFTCRFPMERVLETDLLENAAEEIPLTGPHSFGLDVTPFAVVTCKIYLQQGGML